MNTTLQLEFDKQLFTHISQIVSFLQSYLENKYHFTIIFAAETGSRSYQTHTKHSDLDIKGYYIYSKSSYLKTEKTISHLQSEHGATKVPIQVKILEENTGKEEENYIKIDVDFEFYDIRKLLKEIVSGHGVDENIFWFKSSLIHIDKIPQHIKKEIFSYGQLPLYQIGMRFKNYFKRFKKHETILAKDLMNTIIQGLMIQYMMDFKETEGLIMDIFQNLDNLLNIYQKTSKNEDKVQEILFLKRYFSELYETKKGNKKDTLKTKDVHILYWKFVNRILEEQEQNIKQKEDYLEQIENGSIKEKRLENLQNINILFQKILNLNLHEEVQ